MFKKNPILTTLAEKSELHASAFYAIQIIAFRDFLTHYGKINP